MSVPVYATSPLPYAVLGVLVLAVAWRHLPLWLGCAGIAVEVLLVACTTPLGAALLVRSAESRAPPTDACAVPAPASIVVLAGGFRHSPANHDDFGALRETSLQRVFTGVALWRASSNARLVLSGGGGAIPEAVVMANLAISLGVTPNAIAIEDRSHTTWENAQYVAQLMPAIPRRFWLVTSPMHLPRALIAFRAWGFKPCVWPAEPRQSIPALSLGSMLPQGMAAWHAANALHELIGDVVYARRAQRHAQVAAHFRPRH